MSCMSCRNYKKCLWNLREKWKREWAKEVTKVDWIFSREFHGILSRKGQHRARERQIFTLKLVILTEIWPARQRGTRAKIVANPWSWSWIFLGKYNIFFSAESIGCSIVVQQFETDRRTGFLNRCGNGSWMILNG
jgi:hypothetical protein